MKTLWKIFILRQYAKLFPQGSVRGIFPLGRSSKLTVEELGIILFNKSENEYEVVVRDKKV